MIKILKRIKAQRIADDLWRLVRIPSPTGKERAAAFVYAEMLSQAGAKVVLDETIKESPSIIGRIEGKKPGKTFQLAGHIDHIDVPHSLPTRTGKIISGRGSADMKNGLAGILECVRVLKETGCDFPGQVLVTVYGLHEAPKGNSAAILNLIKRRIIGDAALVAENEHSAEDRIAITGKGQSIWNSTVSLEKIKSCHELNYPDDAPDLLSAVLKFGRLIQDFNQKLEAKPNRFPLLSPESVFIGQLHYGDFYNRVPDACYLQGTRRWHPGRTFADIRKEFGKLIGGIKLPAGIQINCDWTFVGEAFTTDKNSPVIKAQKDAFKQVTGKSAEYAGLSVVTDAHRLVSVGHIPTVLCGFDNKQAHAGNEYVRLNKLGPACGIMLLTLLNYLHLTERETSR